MARHIDDVISDIDDYVEETADVRTCELAVELRDLAEIVKELVDGN